MITYNSSKLSHAIQNKHDDITGFDHVKFLFILHS